MRTRRSFTTGVSMLFSTMLLAGSVGAQEATPLATPGGPSEGFPVAIHQGTCEEPTSQPAYELGNAVAPGVTEDGDDVETVGVADDVVVLTQATGTLDATLGDLADEGHVIAVHASADDYDTIVACGQIAGVNDDGKVVVALAPLGDSTVVGVAVFDEDNSGVLGLGDDQVQATVYIFDTATGTDATPAS